MEEPDLIRIDPADLRDADDGASHRGRVQVVAADPCSHAFVRDLDAARIALRRQEQMTGEILEAAAQIHRRELRVRKSRRLAENRFDEMRGGAAYQIGRLMLDGGASLFAWVKTSLAIRRRIAQKDLESASTSISGDDDVVALDEDKKILRVPLTLRDQRLRIPASECQSTVWITLLGKQLNSRATIEIGFPEPKGQAFQAGVNPIPADVGGSDRIRRFTLVGNQAIRLLELPPSSAALDIRLRRIRGDFGIARIERVPSSANVSEWRGGLRASPESNPIVAGTASALRRSRVSYSAADLELKLWGGFAQYAIPSLEELKCDTGAPADEREAAAWYLSRWHYVEENYLQALENVEFCSQIRRDVRKRTRVAELQCLIKLGRYEEANAVLDHAMKEHAALDFPLIRSTVFRHLEESRGRSVHVAEAAQLEAINAVLTSSGLARITKKRPDEPLTLGNIVARAEPQTAHQREKVSVVVPAFNCSATIAWVLDSIISQTWRNLEVIVVDDRSTDDTCEIVESFCIADPRVHLIRKDTNDGAYAARNAGARVATGDLLVIHDSDDWSHPQRIELQVRELLKSPATVAVKSYWVRVSMRIEIQGAWITRGSVFDLNFSSLLVRRKLLHEIGYWDEVPVAGDAEFYSRVRSLYGESSVVRLPERYLLAFSLAREDSLTRSKATHLRSMFHGLRWNYRDAYLFWHDKLQTQARATELPFDSGASRRPFPLPLGMMRRAAVRQCYDLIVVSDFSLGSDNFREALDYVIAAGRCRLRTAVLHWPQFESFTRAPLNARVYEACLKFGVDILSAGDSVYADTVLFASPSVLQYQLDTLPDIHAGRLILLVSEIEAGSPACNGIPFDPAIVRSRLRALFQAEDVWAPTSLEVARVLEDYGNLRDRRTDCWLPVIDTTVWAQAPIEWRGSSRPSPIVGRHVADPSDWSADPVALSSFYGVDPAREVRVMGDPDHVRSVLGELPANWRFVPFDGKSVREFLLNIDFFMCFPDERRIAGSERAVVEALAAGVPVILTPGFKETFGDAATYSTAELADEVVMRLWRSKDDYVAQAERGRRFVYEKCDVSLLSARLADLKTRAPCEKCKE